MKSEIKHSFLAVFFMVAFIFMNFSCQKEPIAEQPIEEKEPYILNYIDPIEPNSSDFFVKVTFANFEIFYSISDSNIVLARSSSSGVGNMKGEGFTFICKNSDEKVGIMFYAPEETPTFNFQTANYRYGHPWNGISGANIEYFTPAGQPYTFNRYLGINITFSYFYITWVDEFRICGKFRAKLIECCGGDLTFWVNGEFSIPKFKF